MSKQHQDDKTGSSGVQTSDLEYVPDMDRLVRERITAFLNLVEGERRAHEIADAIDSSTDYTRRIANELYDENEIEKSWGQPVVGHPMPDGQTIVLVDNLQRLLNIVNRYAPEKMAEVLGHSIEEVRNFIASEIAVGEGHPLGTQKVSYSIPSQASGGADASSVANAD